MNNESGESGERREPHSVTLQWCLCHQSKATTLKLQPFWFGSFRMGFPVMSLIGWSHLYPDSKFRLLQHHRYHRLSTVT